MYRYIVQIFIIISGFNIANGKYVEGHLKTFENWAFLARFCFLSHHGQYEYHIEYSKSLGVPNLLLYYDSETQWPAVYKTKKTCAQKEAVLSIQDNQIIPLSTLYPDSIRSGCYIRDPATSEDDNGKHIRNTTKKPKYPTTTEDATYFDQFLKTTTADYTTTEENFNITTSDTNAESTTMEEITTINYETKLEEQTENLFDPNVSLKENSRIKRHSLDTEGKATLTVVCRQKGRFLSARERWWYIAVSNCRTNKGLDIRYKFLMTNGEPGDYWHEHFSADEMYILPILMFYCMVYLLMFLAVLICSVELRSRHLLHTTYKVFCTSVVLQEFGILANSIAYVKYALSGLGPHNTLGSVIMASSEVVFLTLLLLMSKGFTITRARLSGKTIIKLVVFINTYVITYFILYAQSEKFDPGEVLYLYESVAGFGLCGLRIVAWGIFICSVATTIKKYPEKGTFYYPFSVFGSLWFISGPAFILIANSHIDNWVRESVVCGVQLFIAFAGHAFFLFLTVPSRANKNFPYHIRTSQIGVAENQDGDFVHHPYEPSQQTYIIPLTRRTEELLNGVYSQYLPNGSAHLNELPPIPARRKSHISFPLEEPSAPSLTHLDGNNTQPTSPNFLQNSTGDLNENPASPSTNVQTPEQSKSGQRTPTSDTILTPNVDEQFDKLKSNPFVIQPQAARRNKLLLQPLDRSKITLKNAEITRLSFRRGGQLKNETEANGDIKTTVPKLSGEEEEDSNVPLHLFASKNL
ncbi:transmembrane protein 145-like [Ctenocephalides felis]|uniref:transmembrane protein 145-like n=1 Tax=Ctenocephalides felis TaxID=7515 RepID=UPI000E6E4FBD|nr:transmembrane protein 145-like [Ctenocephalides felis]